MQATHLNEVSMGGKYGVQFLKQSCLWDPPGQCAEAELVLKSAARNETHS